MIKQCMLKTNREFLRIEYASFTMNLSIFWKVGKMNMLEMDSIDTT